PVAIAALWSLRRLSQRAVARRFESRYSELGTTMTNAVQFAGETSSANQPVRELLRQQAVAVGRDKARRIATWPVAKRGVVAALIATAAALCIWAAGPVLFPDVFAAVLPRLTDPTGDHPPYSRVKIEAKAATASVLYGGECEIHATASGAPVEKLFLIAQPKDGPPIQTVMFRRPDNSYFQTLTNLREQTRFWVTDGRARSRYQAIDVKLTPRITLVQLTTDYPAYTGIASREAELKETALEVPQFSSLAFRVASNRPLQHGSITITPLLGGEPQTVELSTVPDHA